MRKLILIVHSSVDGFVAGPDGGFDNFISDEEHLEFVCSVTDDADAAMFGRVSFQLLNSYWPTATELPNATKNIIKYSNWYNKVPKYVLSRSLQTDGLEKTFTISGNNTPEIDKIKQGGDKNILLFGGPTAAHSLIEQGVLDGFWLIVHPVIFGQGIPLFKKEMKKLIKLKLIMSRQLSNGMMAMNYLVEK
jgi:dihydrofolate reductase